MQSKTFIIILFAAIISAGLLMLSGLDEPVGVNALESGSTPNAPEQKPDRAAKNVSFNDGDTGSWASRGWTDRAPGSDPATHRQNNLIDRKRLELRPAVQQLIDRARVLQGAALSLEMREAVKRFDAEDMRPALLAVQEMPPGPKRRAVELALLNQWGRNDPLGALEYSDQVTEVKYRYDMRQEIMAGWGEVEPVQALAFVEMNQEYDPANSLTRQIFNAVPKGDTESGLLFLESVDPEKYAAYIRGALYQMYENNSDRIVEWTSSLEEGDLRNTAMNGLLENWARYDPQSAMAWMERSYDAEHLDAAQNILSRAWAQSDPQRAADWANGFSDENKSGRLMQQVLSQWLRYDPDGAAAWIIKQEPSPKLDSSIRTHAYQFAHRNPGYAISWAESISNTQQRGQTVEYIAQHWHRKDPDAARAYVQQSNALTEKQKNTLLTQFQKK